MSNATIVTDMTQAVRLDLEPDEAGGFLIAYASHAGPGEHERHVIGTVALGPSKSEPIFAKFVLTMQEVVASYLRARYGGDDVIWRGKRDLLS